RRRALVLAESPGRGADFLRLDGTEDASPEMDDQRGGVEALAAGLDVAHGRLLEGSDGLFAIGMTFPEPRFEERAELFGSGAVASLKALANASSSNGSGGIGDAF